MFWARLPVPPRLLLLGPAHAQMGDSNLMLADLNWFGNYLSWYESNCDGYWEHSYGINIQSTDDPGFSITIDLKETECEGAPSRIIEHDFLKRYEENPVKRWYKIEVEQDKFVAYSSIASFDEVFRVFFELVAECRALKGIAPWGSPAD
jgi:hypothetical protein